MTKNESEKKQTRRIRWILFYVVVSIFAAVAIYAILMICFQIGNPKPSVRDFLFNVFIGEVVITVMVLFYKLFNLKKKLVEVEETPVLKFNGK